YLWPLPRPRSPAVFPAASRRLRRSPSIPALPTTTRNHAPRKVKSEVPICKLQDRDRAKGPGVAVPDRYRHSCLSGQAPDGDPLDGRVFERADHGYLVFNDVDQPLPRQVRPAGVADEHHRTGRTRPVEVPDHPVRHLPAVEDVTGEQDLGTGVAVEQVAR